MLDIKKVRANPKLFDQTLEKRNHSAISKELLSVDENNRNLISELQKIQEERNSKSKLIGEHTANGKNDEAEKSFSTSYQYYYIRKKDFNKEFYLYDIFDLPPNSQPFPKHSASLHQEVVYRFQGNKNVKIIKGILPESLKDNCPKKIAFVHIDLNNTLAEIGVLKFIFDRIVSGGIIILDDFGWSAYSEQQQKEKDFFQKRNLKVMELPTGQGIVLKR